MSELNGLTYITKSSIQRSYRTTVDYFIKDGITYVQRGADISMYGTCRVALSGESQGILNKPIEVEHITYVDNPCVLPSIERLNEETVINSTSPCESCKQQLLCVLQVQAMESSMAKFVPKDPEKQKEKWTFDLEKFHKENKKLAEPTESPRDFKWPVVTKTRKKRSDAGQKRSSKNSKKKVVAAQPNLSNGSVPVVQSQLPTMSSSS